MQGIAIPFVFACCLQNKINCGIHGLCAQRAKEVTDALSGDEIHSPQLVIDGTRMGVDAEMHGAGNKRAVVDDHDHTGGVIRIMRLHFQWNASITQSGSHPDTHILDGVTRSSASELSRLRLIASSSGPRGGCLLVDLDLLLVLLPLLLLCSTFVFFFNEFY